MSIVNLLELEGNKVSTDFNSYSLLLYGVPKIGKTELITNLYDKEKTLILAFEAGTKNIPGVKYVAIDSYSTLMNYVNQLKNPKVREKFDTIVFDTLDKFAFVCKKYVLDNYGKDTLGDAKSHGGAYEIFDAKALAAILPLQGMDYNLAYISHSDSVEKTDLSGNKYNRFIIKAPKRIANLVKPEVDYIWFGYRLENNERVIYTRETAYFEAGSRVGQMPPELPWDAKKIKEIFAENVAKDVDDNYITEEKVSQSVAYKEKVSFEEIMNEIKTLGNELFNNGKQNECNEILARELGTDDNGNQRTLDKCTATQIPVLEVILQQLKSL